MQGALQSYLPRDMNHKKALEAMGTGWEGTLRQWASHKNELLRWSFFFFNITFFFL